MGIAFEYVCWPTKAMRRKIGAMHILMLVFDNLLPILNRQTLQREAKIIFCSYHLFLGRPIVMSITVSGEENGDDSWR
jgi:hypothetical protein